MSSTRTVPAAVVRGMLAGLAGTIAMTATQRLEMSLTHRSPSSVPGQVGAHLLPGRDASSAADVDALNGAVHWGHGVTMGAVRGLLDLAGRHGLPASALHFAAVWGGDAMLYRALGVAELPWRWSPAELATDLLHKGVYAAGTGLAYDALRR